MMIIPDKHTDPELSIINISSFIIGCLQRDKILKYDDLLNSIIKSTNTKAKDVFLYAISFLYLLGKIEYISTLDALKLIQNENY